MFGSIGLRWAALALMSMLGALPGAALGLDLTGAGASSPYPIYAKWAAQYQREQGVRVNYQSIGSGGGEQQIIAGTVDFGATDVPLSAETLAAHQLVQFPAVMGATVPIVNLPGVAAGALRLDGPLLADIFLGDVRRWDDARIRALNPGVPLPDAEILVVHRADGSGTTANWTDYLARVSPAWRTRVGQGKAVKWPVGQGGKGNEGVAAYVKQLTHSLGYVEYAYARRNGMAWVRLRNPAGQFVAPTPESIEAAAAQADWSVPGMAVSMNAATAPDAWPVAAASFILVPQRVRRRARAARLQGVLGYFDWAWRSGGALASQLDYVPLSPALAQQARAQWDALRGADNQPLWP